MENQRKRGGRTAGTPNKRSLDGQDACARYADRALRVLVSIMQKSPSDVARARAAESILNRAWGRPLSESEAIVRRHEAEMIARLEEQQHEQNIRMHNLIKTPEDFKKHFGMTDEQYQLLRMKIHAKY